MRLFSVLSAVGGILFSSLAAAAGEAPAVYGVSTPGTSLVVKAEQGKMPRFLYFGPSIETPDIDFLCRAGGPVAYPVLGLDCATDAALSVVHPDGNLSLDMAVESVSLSSDEDSEILTVTIRDKVYPFSVDLCWKAYHDVDMIEARTVIRNDEDGPVTLTRFDSAFLPIRRDAWLAHLSGTWAGEARLTTEQLELGVKMIADRNGVRNSHNSHAEVMFGLDGRPQENSGAVIGAALCYSGNYQLRIDTDASDYHKFFAGINPDNSQYVLEPGESFETPPVALTYSIEGLGGASRNFHDWARAHRLAHGDRERKVLLNSWEGISYFITEQAMDDMISDLASLGGELFVMDDGWFGDRYPRMNDRSSLGDWTVDREKLPHGIGHLVQTAASHGVGFGIWIEPEMTDTTSELIETHPDWVVRIPQRDIVTGRAGAQVLLDLTNPDVQDFVFGVVDSLMTQNPGIEYIKWDANNSGRPNGADRYPADRQSRFYIDYHRGLASVLDRIRAKYPDLTMQACAGGGGRVNYGILPWFDEFWTSDNTDALQRIYIQWGTSYFFPAIAMGSHISASPNHQTARDVPLKYRIDVAMSGRLGLELQPRSMTDQEREMCRKAIGEYKEIRPVVQFGDLYRLVSPYDGKSVASLMYCSRDKSRAVFFWWKLEHFQGMSLPRVRMAGLDPARHYRICELDRIDTVPLPLEGLTFSGAFLMSRGLDIPVSHTLDPGHRTSWSSRVLYLEAVD